MTTSPGEGTREIVPKTNVNVEMPTEMKDRLARAAEDTSLSQAAIVRLALERWLTDHGYPKRSA